MASGFKFESNIPAIQKQLNQIAERAMEKVCLMIEAAIKSGAPVMTGGLRDSINHRIKGSGAQITGQIGTPLMYGVYVEFGTGDFAENGAGRKSGWAYPAPDGSWHFTHGQPPQKFMRNGFRQNKDKIKDILGKEFSANFKGR